MELGHRGLEGGGQAAGGGSAHTHRGEEGSFAGPPLLPVPPPRVDD